jgi:hypothetical protein
MITEKPAADRPRAGLRPTMHLGVLREVARIRGIRADVRVTTPHTAHGVAAVLEAIISDANGDRIVGRAFVDVTQVDGLIAALEAIRDERRAVAMPSRDHTREDARSR